MYLSVMCPSVSVIGLSIVRLSVCHFSVPSVCDVLPISVIGLSISVLLSNCPPVCPTDCESDLSSDCCLESSYAPEIPQVTAVAVGL